MVLGLLTLIMTSDSNNTDTSKEQVLADNERWLKLMAEQADQHRKARDPRLYRQTSQNTLIRPPLPDSDS